MHLKYKLLCIAITLSFTKSPAQVGDFLIETLANMPVKRSKSFITLKFGAIEGEPHYIEIFEDSIILTNISTKEQYVRDVKPLEIYQYFFDGLRFLNLNKCAVIHGVRGELVLYDFEKESQESVDFKPFLRDSEALSVGMFQPMPLVRNKLIIPLVNKDPKVETQLERNALRSKPPFLIYDLKSGKITRPANGKFWPEKYKQAFRFEDFAPTFSHDGKNTIFFSYRHSNEIREYNLETGKLSVHTISELDYLPDPDSSSSGGISGRREFNIINASVRNYIYNPELELHFLLVKDEAPFIVNDRINQFHLIDWKLFLVNKDFSLKASYSVKMENLEWYAITNTKQGILLPGALYKENDVKFRPIKSLQL
jgi:hypothetical protein